MRPSMHRVRIGSRWQITIPREIREAFGIRPGQILWMRAAHGAIQIFLDKPADETESDSTRSSKDG